MPWKRISVRGAAWLVALALTYIGQCVAAEPTPAHVHEVFGRFVGVDLAPGGRLDAVCDLGGGAVICGSRRPHAGRLFLSEDWGANWRPLPSPTDVGITCITARDRNTFYLLNEASEVFGTKDGGRTWRKLAKLLAANRNTQGGAATYGISVTRQGTLLVTDTTTAGGHVYRSTDGGEVWSDLGVVARNALYRFTRVANGILINDWSGWVYKSVDDGLTWLPMQRLGEAALFATESLGYGHVLQADQAGHVYHSSNTGETWRLVTTLDGAADDFVALGYGAVLYSTYTSNRSVYLSLNFGRDWAPLDGVPFVDSEDWMDHVIRLDHPDSVIVIAGTGKGRLLRCEIPRRDLIALVDRSTGRPAAAAREFDAALLAEYVDFVDLDEPEDVLIHKGHAYVPCREGNNIAVFDLADKERPQLVHSIRGDDLHDVFGVAAEGNHLFAVSMTNAVMSCYDISNPARPVSLGAIRVGGPGAYLEPVESNYTRLRKIAVQDGLAFVTHASEGKVYVIDVSHPASSAIVSEFHTGDGAFAVLPHGSALYLAGYGPGSSVIAVDISDPRHPRIADRHFDREKLRGTCALAVQGNLLFAAAYNAGAVSVYDISRPLELRQVGYLVDRSLRGPGRIAVAGTRAYVIDSTTHLLVTVDISDPTRLRVVRTVGDASRLRMPYGIAIDGDRVFVAGRQSSDFLVLDRTKLSW